MGDSLCAVPRLVFCCSVLFSFLIQSTFAAGKTAAKPRARDLGVPFDGTPGPFNAITDVAGVTVGHTTLISGEGKLWLAKGRCARV